MGYWHTIPSMAERATRETGKAITPEDIFNLCRRGRVRVGARIPGWVSAGIGELQWHYADGSQVTQTYSFDGIARWLDCAKLENLLIHDRVTLAGVQCPDEESGITMTAGLDSPFVTMDDLRIPEREFGRILAALNGEADAPREPKGAERTPPQVAAEPGAHLFQQWQERTARIYKLLKTEASMPPVEQEAAIRLRERFEQELRQLEANPKFIAAVEGYIAHEQRTVEACKPGSNQGLVEQAKASIVDWSAHLARLRPTAMDSNSTEDKAAPETQPQKGEQAQEGGENDSPKSTNWKLQVQAEAARMFLKLRAIGCKPTKHSIKDDLAKWCKETGVKTKSLIHPDAEYIYRHALRDWTPPD